MSEIYKPKTSDQIIDSIKRYLISKNSSLNNFNTGSRLLTLIEAVSLTSSQTQNDFFQAILKAIPVSIYNGFGFEKKSGVKSTGSLNFSRSTVADQDYVISIGTQILLDGYYYETIEVGYILSGFSTSGSILSQCTEVGEKSNISSGSINTLNGQGSFVNQPKGIESCVNSSAFVGGTDEESDSDRLSRFLLYIDSLVRCTLKGIKYAVLSIEGIKSASVLENFPSNGWVTVYADDGTGSLSAELKAEIEKTLKGDIDDYENYPGYKSAGIFVQVLAPTITTINISSSLSISSKTELSDLQIKNEVETAIQKYTNSLGLGEDWILANVIRYVMDCDNNIYDFYISVPSSNVIIDLDKLAKTGTINITITKV
jgi:uncharacterized phage protein gp47/JayE